LKYVKDETHQSKKIETKKKGDRNQTGETIKIEIKKAKKMNKKKEKLT
jgi:hypothetical protein